MLHVNFLNRFFLRNSKENNEKNAEYRSSFYSKNFYHCIENAYKTACRIEIRKYHNLR